MSDATLARMEHGKYVGVRKESRRDGVCTLQAALAVKRLPLCARFSLTVPAPAEPAPCPVFAALSYL